MKRTTEFAILIYVLNGVIEITALPYLYGGGTVTAVRRLCLIWFFIKTVYDAFKKPRAVIIISGAVAFFIMLSSKSVAAPSLFAVIAAAADLDTDRLFKKLFYLLGSAFLATVALSAVGIMPSWQFLRGERARYALGFHYPTDAHSVFLSTVLCYLYAFRKRLDFFVLSAFLFANVLLYLFTDGRLGFLLCCAVIFYALIRSVTKSELKPPRWVFVGLPFVICVFSLFLVFFFNGGALNRLLSDRLHYAAAAFEKYPPGFFGRAVKWQGWGGFGYAPTPDGFEYNFVDISYARIFIDFGIAGALTLLCGFARSLFKQTDGIKRAVIIFTLIWAVIEPTMTDVVPNAFMMLLLL